MKQPHSGASRDITGAPIVSGHLKTTSARRNALETGLARALSLSLERASWAQCRVIGSWLGLAYFAADGKRRALAVDNIAQALRFNRAQSERIARRSAQNWGMTTCEFLRSPVATPQEIRDYVAVRGFEHLQSAMRGGKGAILVTAHLGNWELMAARLGQEAPTAGIVRPLSNMAAQNLMSGVRQSHNLGLISKNSAVRPSLKWLKNNDLLFILPDRHAGAQGELLPLFGRLTRFETAPARLALMSGAPILMVYGARRSPWLRDGRIEVEIAPPFSLSSAKADRGAAILEGTKQVITGLETMVRAHPDQWSWMLRRWRDRDTGKSSLLPPTD